MNKYVPLHCHSHFSLLDGLSKASKIAERIEELELDHCAITDHGSLSGSIDFVKEMRGHKIAPILGCELYFSEGPKEEKNKENRHLFHQVVLSKNLTGWSNLVKAVSISNKTDNYYYRPRLDYKYFEDNPQRDWITFSGHLGSRMSDMILDGDKLHADWRGRAARQAGYLRELFGKDNFYMEIQLIDSKVNDTARIVGEALREIAKDLKIPCVATADSHYCKKEDVDDHRVLLCTNLNTSFAQVKQKLDNNEDVSLSSFFKSDNYHIPSYEEMAKFHTEEELENTLMIAEQCANYSVLRQPMELPFECPESMDADGYLRQLCRNGWRNKPIPKEKQSVYVDRIKRELSVLQGAGLSSYFLLVYDIVRYCQQKDWLVGPGRGSAAGCLVSYLVGITSVDPIQYDLMFERFYNAGRNTKDHVSFPDIDVDIPVNKREQIIQYVKDKYGHDNVSQMATFQTMKACNALKNVLRAYGNISFPEMNEITSHIPKEEKISGELQEMKEELGESSIIRWALEHRGDKFRAWCHLDNEGNLQGPLAKRFEQAIRLEGVKTAQSKHASGIVISAQPLEGICPMILDPTTNNPIAGLPMSDVEAVGLTKVDLLGLNLLDKVDGVRQILRTGDIIT
jgi:DNA polymerase-3 subunit alpha